MTSNSIEQLQQQLKDHETAGAELRKQLAAVQAGLRSEAIAEIHRVMALHNLTVADLTTQRNSSGKKKSSNAGPAKYRDPKTGKTWTGHGMRPNWLKEYAAAGQNEAEFLVPPIHSNLGSDRAKSA